MNAMRFSNPEIQKLWDQDATVALSPYRRLVHFEKVLSDYVANNVLSKDVKIEAYKTLILINNAQVKALEKMLDTDLDGDGKIG